MRAARGPAAVLGATYMLFHLGDLGIEMANAAELGRLGVDLEYEK